MLGETERRVLYAVAILLAAGAVIYVLAPVVTLFLLASLIAYIANPLVSRAQRAGVPRSATILLLLLLLVLAVAALAFALVPMAQREFTTFTAHAPAYMDWLQARILRATHGRYTPDLHALKRHILAQWQGVGADVARLLPVATASGLHILVALARLMLILVVTFYLLRDWDDIGATAVEILPGRYRGPIVRFAGEVDVQLGRLLRGQLTVMIALAILYTVGLSIAGLDLALPVGVVTGFLSFIPYLGFFTGLFTASLAVLLQYHDVRHLLFVFAAFGFGEMMESMVLGPRLVGRSIGLHPLLVIFAVLTGGQLFGFAGILLALPVSAVLMVWLRRVHARYRHSAWSE